jgi:hypothetical protein
MKNKKIYILMVCLAVSLAGFSFNLAKKQNVLEVKNVLIVNNVATSTEKNNTQNNEKAVSNPESFKIYSYELIDSTSTDRMLYINHDDGFQVEYFKGGPGGVGDEEGEGGIDWKGILTQQNLLLQGKKTNIVTLFPQDSNEMPLFFSYANKNDNKNLKFIKNANGVDYNCKNSGTEKEFGCSMIECVFRKNEKENDYIKMEVFCMSNRRNIDKEIYQEFVPSFKFIDKRIVLSGDNVNTYFKATSSNCGDFKYNKNLDWTDSVPYFDFSNRVQFSVPYNENWGSSQYRIKPFDFSDKKIEFGPIRLIDNRYCGRSFRLVFAKKRNLNEITLKNIVLKKIGSFDVAEYFSNDDGDHPTIEAVGNKNNFILQSLIDSVGNNEEFSNLEELVKAVYNLDQKDGN